MQEQDPLTPDEAELHEALRRLKPARPGFDLSRIALAAQERQRRQVWRWRGIAAFLAAGCVALPLLRGGQKVVYVRQPVPAPNLRVAMAQPALLPEPLPVVLTGDNYLAVRSRVLAFGPGALKPPPPAPPERPIKLFDLLNSGGHS